MITVHTYVYSLYKFESNDKKHSSTRVFTYTFEYGIRRTQMISYIA